MCTLVSLQEVRRSGGNEVGGFNSWEHELIGTAATYSRPTGLPPDLLFSLRSARRDHGSRSTISGSTRIARRVGTEHAASETSATAAATAAYVTGSVGFTPCSSLDSHR